MIKELYLARFLALLLGLPVPVLSSEEGKVTKPEVSVATASPSVVLGQPILVEVIIENDSPVAWAVNWGGYLGRKLAGPVFGAQARSNRDDENRAETVDVRKPTFPFDVEPVAVGDLLADATAVCRARVVAVEELKGRTGKDGWFVGIPAKSVLVSLWLVRGECPDRFEVAWTGGATPGLDTIGAQVVAFMRQSVRAGASVWELAHETWGAWAIESRRSIPLSDEEVRVIAPELVDRISGLPPDLFSTVDLEIGFGRQHRLFVPCRALFVSDLERWLEQPEPSSGTRGLEEP